MSPQFCSSAVWRRAIFIVAVSLAATSLAACSEKAGSLADYIAAICATPFRSASKAEAPYLADNVSAMTKMMIDMGIRPSGDVDADFVAMMVPHHQGAIEMAQAELRYGHNEALKRMAQEIIVTQQQEIAAMRFAVGQPLPPSVPSPDQLPPSTQTDLKSSKPAQSRNRDMRRFWILFISIAAMILPGFRCAIAGQVPAAASDPDFPSAIETGFTPPSSFQTRSL